MCGNIDFRDIDILGGLEHEVYYATRNYDTIDLNPFDEGEALELDFNATAEDIAAAIVEDPFGTIGTAALLITGFGGPLALALNQGASTAYRGGSAEDILTSMALTYAGGKVGEVVSNQASTALTQNFGEAVASSPLSTAIIGGTEQFSTTLIHSFNPADGSFNFEAASNAFLTGNLASGIGYTLGAIDDTLIDTIGEDGAWTNLGAGIRDSATAGIVAAVQGGDITEDALRNLVSGYTNNIEILSGLQESLGDTFGDDMVRVIGEGLNSSLNAAIAGGLEPTDAFFANLKMQADDKIRDFVDSSEGLALNDKLDTLFGNKGRATEAFETLQAARTNATNAANGYTAIYNEEDRLYQLYTEAVDTYNANKNQTNLDAVNAAGTAFTTYSNDNADAKAEFLSTYNEIAPTLPGLTSAYDTSLKSMLTDIDDLGDEFPSIEELGDETIALGIRPNFDPEAYANFYGLTGDVNAAGDFLFSGQDGPVSTSEVNTTLNSIRLSTVKGALATKGITLASLDPAQLASYLAFAEQEITNIRSITGMDFDRFANTMIADAGLTPELTVALKDAGFVPESADVDYNVFLSGEYIKLDEINPDSGANYFVDTTGLTSEDVKDLLSDNGFSTQNIVNVGNGFYNREDSGAALDLAFDAPSLSEVDTAVVDFYNNPPETGVLDPVTLGEGVDINTLISNDAVLVNTDGQLSWELPSTQQEKLGGTNVSSVVAATNSNIKIEDIAFNALYEPLAFTEIPTGFTYLSDDRLTAYTSDYRTDENGVVISGASTQQLPPVSGLTAATVAGLNDAQGRQFDSATGGVLWYAYNEIRRLYEEELPEDQKPGFSNAASIVTGMSGEMLQAVSGLATIAGANPNNTVGQTAKSLLALSGDLRSDAWVAGAEDMAERSQNYDVEWRENNPGREPTIAQKGYLKAKAIFGNLVEHPVQFLAENVASEVLQEVPIFIASGGVGNVAKRLLLEGGEAYAQKIGTRAALGTALTLDAAEAFGGTAAGAFDETYANAIAATNEDGSRKFTDEEATTLALDTAQKAGTIAVIALAATAGIGGQALARSVLGDNASEFSEEAFGALTKKITDGTQVTIKEGSTEFIEEALPQLFTATVNSQIDPNYDVAGSVFENGFLGSISGVGVGATLYSGNAVADALLSLNSTVSDTIKNAESAEAATIALNGLGVTDTTVLNNLLNSKYDTMYVTTNEVGQIIASAAPGFEADADTIASYVGERSEADTRAEIEQFVGDNYVTEEEVDTAATAAGITLTDEEKTQYVGQSTNETSLTTFSEDVEAAKGEIVSFFEENNYDPTDAQVNNFLDGLTLTDARKEAISSYIDPRQITEAEARQFFRDLGYEPAEDEIDRHVQQSESRNYQNTTSANIGTYVDPRQTTEAEVRAAFEAAGFTPTDEQVQQFVGQLDQTRQETAVGEFIDPLQTTRDEVVAAFDAAGFEATDEEIDSFVGQLNQADQELKISDYIDPLQTTKTEVEAAFAAAGYTPTEAEIERFVGQLEQTAQETAIGDYVDPRLATDAEIRAAFAAAGFTPTDEEVALFTGQFDQETQEAGVTDYVDPRQVTTAEIRAAYEALGLVDVLQEDVDRFTGQRDEAAALEELRQYAPTATLNIVNQVIGSPAVEDDPNTTDIDESKEATGLYASVENSLAEAVGGLENISLEDVKDTVNDIVSNLATNTDVTNALAAAVASLPEVPTTTDLQNAVTEAFAGLNDLSETDVTNILTTELEKLENLSSDEVQTIVDNTVGQKETLNEDGTVDQESTGLFGEIGSLAADIDTLGTAVGDLDTTVGTLGTTVGDLGTTVDTLGTTVGDLGTTVDTLGTTVGDLGTTVGTLGTTVGDLETTLGADINAIAELIGKPAREVTQTDVDFVIDLVAQQNVSDELVLEYDVTGDGTVDQLDVDLLQQTLTGEDTTLADTSIFTPATGLFAQQEQDTQTTQDLITDLATDINTQINTQTQQQNVADLAELLAGARDARGTRVDVETPQELADITPYDFQTIFRDQQQAGKFVGPYGDPRAAFGIPANISRPPLGRVSGFSRGGQVEDNNDMLLRILGELE